MIPPHTRLLIYRISCSAVCIAALLAYPSAETLLQPRRLIDSHTAGVLPKAHFDFETRIYSSGDSTIQGAGLYLGISVGITDRLNIGLGYGGDGLVGRGKAKPNPYPGAHIKYRLFEENYLFPALAIGYDHQGYGGIEYEDNYKGYIYKSQGFFAALSKNYLLFSKIQLGFHGAINYSLEEVSTVKWPNGYIGMDLGVNEELYLAVEYDLALQYKDPGTDKYYNPLNGYFNVGLRWAFSPSFYLEFDAKDIFQKKVENTSDRKIGWSRELKLVYVTQF
ncbi:MAG: hypothetical protein GF350_03150 [Chitinivibrionales bacterium]|nr:hypothetical protein [Chitinivibrionales bacterium]